MSKRNLRKGTRRNYEEMASGGVDSALNSEEEQEPGFSGTVKNTREGEHENNNNNNTETDLEEDQDDRSNGVIINREIILF